MLRRAGAVAFAVAVAAVVLRGVGACSSFGSAEPPPEDAAVALPDVATPIPDVVVEAAPVDSGTDALDASKCAILEESFDDKTTPFGWTPTKGGVKGQLLYGVADGTRIFLRSIGEKGYLSRPLPGGGALPAHVEIDIRVDSAEGGLAPDKAALARFFTADAPGTLLLISWHPDEGLTVELTPVKTKAVIGLGAIGKWVHLAIDTAGSTASVRADDEELEATSSVPLEAGIAGWSVDVGVASNSFVGLRADLDTLCIR